MAQRLRVITVLTEDLGLVPSTHSYSPVTLGDPIPSSNLRGQNMHADHRHTETHRGRGSEKERKGHEKMSNTKKR